MDNYAVFLKKEIEVKIGDAAGSIEPWILQMMELYPYSLEPELYLNNWL